MHNLEFVMNSIDSLDKLILENDLRISSLIIQKDLDLIIFVLNNQKVLRVKLSNYPRLKNARIEELNNWRLIAKGIGIRWEDLDEDLSLKEIIKPIILDED